MEKIKNILRKMILKMRWKQRNKHNYTWIDTVFDVNKVHVGKYTYGQINAITYKCDNSSLYIGNYCSIAPSVKFLCGGEHHTDRLSTFPFSKYFVDGEDETLSKGNIVVKDDVWIGENALILSGVEVGQGAIIAAGAVVTKDVEPYAVVAGVPARTIKKRFSDELISELLKVDFSKLTEEKARKNRMLLTEKIDNTQKVRELIQTLYDGKDI